MHDTSASAPFRLAAAATLQDAVQPAWSSRQSWIEALSLRHVVGRNRKQVYRWMEQYGVLRGTGR
jgi:hypothetical protein